MKKTNKIMMISVSVLLSLVLITSSVVSGTLAKYVTSNNSSDSVIVAKWGAEIEVKLSDEIDGILKSEDDTHMKVEFTSDDSIRLGSGKEYLDALSIKFSGTSEVALKIKLALNIEYADGLKIPAGTGETATEMHFMPIGFTLGAKSSESSSTIQSEYVVDSWTSGDDAIALCNNIEKQFISGIEKTSIGFEGASSCAEKYFAPNESLIFKKSGGAEMDTLLLGFGWDDSYTNAQTGYNYSEIGDYVLEQCATTTFGVKFTIIIEQVG